MKERSELYSIFKSFYMEIKTQFIVPVRIFRSNNAPEYYHDVLSPFFDDHAIIHWSSRVLSYFKSREPNICG